MGPPANLEIGEIVLHQGRAARRPESRRSTLYLTNQRLVYAARALGLHGDWSIALADIATLEVGRTLFVVPNKLDVRARDGRREVFVVDSPEEWVSRIRNALASPYR